MIAKIKCSLSPLNSNLVSTFNSVGFRTLTPPPAPTRQLNLDYYTAALQMGCASSTGLDVSHEEVVAHQAIVQQIIKDKEATKYASSHTSMILSGGADCFILI